MSAEGVGVELSEVADEDEGIGGSCGQSGA